MADISKIRVKGIEYDIKDSRVGDIQIFDADELPEASEDYIEQILRVDGKLYQCVLKEVNAWIPLEDDSEILEDGTKYRTKFSSNHELISDEGSITIYNYEGELEGSTALPPFLNVDYVYLNGNDINFDDVGDVNSWSLHNNPRIYFTVNDNQLNEGSFEYLEKLVKVSGYIWKLISGGQALEVDELPEEGEEGVTYLLPAGEGPGPTPPTPIVPKTVISDKIEETINIKDGDEYLLFSTNEDDGTTFKLPSECYLVGICGEFADITGFENHTDETSITVKKDGEAYIKRIGNMILVSYNGWSF